MMKKHGILTLITMTAVIVLFIPGPIAQPLSYHNFADTRPLLGMPNGLDVLSNAVFIITGGWGFVFVLSLLKGSCKKVLIMQYLMFFSGVFLSGLGSAYYHLSPSNATLVWDRLPMSIAFMAFLSSMISESIDRRTGGLLLVPLLAMGIASVLYWSWTESMSRGDLRPYVLVQFLPLILIPVILFLYRPPKTYSLAVWSLAGMYFVSKIFELLDRRVFITTGLVSGHTLKHIFAALGIVFVIKMLQKRNKDLV